MDPRERRLPQFDGRPHHAGHHRPRARDPQRRLRRRGQLAGVLRGVPAMGGRGQVPGRPPCAGKGRRHLHRRRRALRTHEDPHPQRRPRGDRLSGGPARHPLRPRGDGGPADRDLPRNAHEARDPSRRAAAARGRPRCLPQEGRRALRQSQDRRHDQPPVPRRLEPAAEVHPADGARPDRGRRERRRDSRSSRRCGADTAYGESESGKVIPPNDPSWDRLQAAAKPARDDPRAFLAMGDIFGDLADNPAYVAAFSGALGSLWTKGVRATLADYLDGGA